MNRKWIALNTPCRNVLPAGRSRCTLTDRHVCLTAKVFPHVCACGICRARP